jgi:hypothetical protein
MTIRPLNFKLTVWLPALVILTLAGVVPAQAQCLNGLGIFYMDLELPFDADFTGAVTVLDRPLQLNADCNDGSRMALVKIDIPQGCTQANILVEYQGTPQGWTVNLGDSPENNGFGGSFGDPYNAELQILDQRLSVYTAATSPADLDLLAVQDLALTNGSIKLRVADQKVGWGQPMTTLATPNVERLFSIPDPLLDRSVYLGINRVVLDTSRRGCGARRVLISFE